MVDRFTSTGGMNNAASFSNRLAQGNNLEDDSKYVHSLFNTSSNHVSTSQVYPVAGLESTISFVDNIADNWFDGVSGFPGLHDRDNFKVQSRFDLRMKRISKE